MYRFWFERSLPSEYFSLLQTKALITGSASEDPTDPFKGLMGAEAIIASARIRYDKEFFSRVPTLRVVSRTGIGYDNISVPDATARGVAVCFAPEGPVVSTAEHAMLLIFAVAKRLREVENLMRSGRTVDYFNCHQGMELEGQELGLVGLGRIGSRVAKIALAVGMRVLGYDPALSSERARDLGVDRQEHLERLLQRADIVSLHLPLSSATRYLINETRLAQMKRGSILINTSRGGLVDEAALLAALETGQLSGVGLDVFQTEPPNPNSPLLQRENVIATPHIAGALLSQRYLNACSSLQKAHRSSFLVRREDAHRIEGLRVVNNAEKLEAVYKYSAYGDPTWIPLNSAMGAEFNEFRPTTVHNSK